ncbi:MAG: HypC/HybG/HupF family hydrogenase formation chaperone [Myxococcota bacterium]|nr:HypC/HybG/HupF family hydrogenase formation chaperone [Myxococcota bacterium]
MCLAVPGRVLARCDEDGLRLAIVDFGGVRRRICVETLPDARPDDWVLVHAGVALQRLDEAAAAASLALLGAALDPP